MTHSKPWLRVVSGGPVQWPGRLVCGDRQTLMVTLLREV
jgi:hypothetical protein